LDESLTVDFEQLFPICVKICFFFVVEEFWRTIFMCFVCHSFETQEVLWEDRNSFDFFNHFFFFLHHGYNDGTGSVVFLLKRKKYKSKSEA
jgi:hypothetical protein